MREARINTPERQEARRLWNEGREKERVRRAHEVKARADLKKLNQEKIAAMAIAAQKMGKSNSTKAKSNQAKERANRKDKNRSRRRMRK